VGTPWSALVAGLGAAALCLLLFPSGIAALRRLGLVQVVRQQGPAAHLRKAGTPTAGGLIFVPVACIAAWAVAPRDAAVLACILLTAGHAALGLCDDWLKVVRRRPEGLLARYKLAGQLLLAALLVGFAFAQRPEAANLAVPFLRHPRLVLAPLPFALVAGVALVGATNGANFTDGADGLLGSTGLVALAALGVLCWVQGLAGLGTFALAFVGALLAFLRWNWHPARVFMGDTGSMAIGAAFACVGVLSGLLLYLPVVGLLFALEVLSVVAQVIWFRRTGRRLLRMAPLHHHLELSGWGERQLVPRLLLLACAAGALGLIAFWA
jgi:phospho-N-acetylmuramoyl-pentapeptide-transferase